MDKFELLCLLEAISNYAYDIHYTAKGRYFFSDHLFSERLSDVDVKDDFIETFYLGKSEEAPSSADIARKVATLTPQITDNTQDNFKRLRDLIIRALMTIQKYDGTKGEEDILGAIAHILQRHNGLLYRQLIYTPEEIRNDNSDWRDIVSEKDTTQTLENEKAIELENGGAGSGNFGHAGRIGKVGGSAPQGAKKDLTSSAESGNIKLERRSYKNYKGEDVEFETTPAIWAIFDKAKSKEPAITEDVTSAIKKTGAESFGLDFKLKDVKTAVGKIDRERDEKKDYKNKVDTYILSHAWDNVRYSQVSDPEKLKSEMYNTLAELEKKGHKVYGIKNYFDDDENPYNGINVKMISPSNQRYELQFNTQKNFGIKEKELHPIYKLKRDEKDEAKKKEYDARSFEISKTMEFPEGIRTISKKDYLKGGK